MSNHDDQHLDSDPQNAKQETDKAAQSQSGTGSETLSLGNLVPHDSHAFETMHELDGTTMKDSADLPRTDLSFSPKPLGKPLSDGSGSQPPGSMKFQGGLTAELSRELSQPGSLSGTGPGKAAGTDAFDSGPREFKWSGQKDLQASANAGLNFPLGNRQFFQARKSEFLPVEEKPFTEFRKTADDLLNKRAVQEDKMLTPAQKQDIESSWQRIKDSSTKSEALSNALHLARQYQQLRYIEEAKKAVQFSLGLDPDNMIGKQLFSELERTHPADLGSQPVITQGISAAAAPQLTKSALRKRITGLSGGRVMVVGDLLIDELLEGKPERISREAPVLILEHVDTELILGGAGNTAHNISALGGYCHAIGVCGDDEYAHKLSRLLESCDITYSLVQDPSRPTTVKTRILSKSHSLMQQLLRLDRISHEPIDADIEAQLIERIKQSTSGHKAIVLSDYRAGVISETVIKACREISFRESLMIIVDAQSDYSRFHDAFLMTPNQPDTEAFVGYKLESREQLERAGREILQATGAKSLLITRGAEGMALLQRGHELVELPVFNRSEVFDVTGAGDTVVATMALALVTGASLVEAMALGNLAAGIVVRKSGTAVTTQEEMLENLDMLHLPA